MLVLQNNKSMGRFLTFLLLVIPLLIHGQNIMIKPIKFLALGDSYTIGESVAESERWPVQLAKAMTELGQPVEAPRIIATTGWRTDQLKKAILDANLSNDWGMVSLLIGVNNQYQKRTAESYAPEFEELLDMAVKLAGGKRENVFVVSIPDYGFTPFGQPKQAEISKAIDEFNAVNKAITNKKGIRYVNITDLTREGLAKPEYVAGDKLHPSGKMYTIWVERILSALVPRR
jgi:lysophospholipase L1-like esterase